MSESKSSAAAEPYIFDRVPSSDWDPELSLRLVQSVCELQRWIETARHLCDTISVLADQDQGLRSALQKFDVMYRAAGWEDSHHEALVWLQLVQANELARLGTRAFHTGGARAARKLSA